MKFATVLTLFATVVGATPTDGDVESALRRSLVTNSSCLNETVAMFNDSGKDTLSGAYESYFSNFSSLCELEMMSEICSFNKVMQGSGMNRKTQAYPMDEGMQDMMQGMMQGMMKNLTFDGEVDLSSLSSGTIKDACTNATGKMCSATVNTTVTGTYSGYSLWIRFMTVALPVCLASICDEVDPSAIFGPVIDSQMEWIKSALESLNIQNGTFVYEYLNGTCTN